MSTSKAILKIYENSVDNAFSTYMAHKRGSIYSVMFTASHVQVPYSEIPDCALMNTNNICLCDFSFLYFLSH